MISHYDADLDWQSLASENEAKGLFGVRPREELGTKYGDAPGLIPFGEAEPDKLVEPEDYKDVIEDCIRRQVFPIYHQYDSWAPPGFRWNQNSLNYCWAWSPVAALMDARAREGKPTVLLSPVSLGWTVNWRNDGNYLESAIAGLKERGVCEATFTPDMHSRSYRQYKPGWEENALQYRLEKAWDLDNRNKATMIQHAISVLATGSPIYMAYNWWGHALECCGVRWDESISYEHLVWQIRNSHDESDIIEMSGSKAVFDEAFGFPATFTVA